MEDGREVKSVFILNSETKEYDEYCSIEDYAEEHGMSRQSVYFKARYANMPGRLDHVRIKKLYLIKVNQEVEDVRVKTTDTVTVE